MTLTKRLLDLGLALVLGLVLLPVVLILSLMILLKEGRPVFYISERMKTVDQPFSLIKFRTMRPVADSANAGVSGGDKAGRVTPFFARMRRLRLDEIPQLWNVIRGDMSFVGPRPPLRRYVVLYPDLYRQVLHNRPGITGLASLLFHAHEERLLAACTTPKETEAVYTRRCIPRKARLDLIYQRRRSLCFDLVLIARTGAKLLPGRR